MKQMIRFTAILMLGVLMGCSSTKVAYNSKATLSPTDEAGVFDVVFVIRAGSFLWQQIASSLLGSQLRLFGSPLSNRSVITAQQDVWNLVASKLSRSCVLGELKQSVSAAE